MSLQRALDIRLDLSTAHNLQTDRQSERTIQILDDILHCYILNLDGNWDDHFPLVEFTYNNSY